MYLNKLNNHRTQWQYTKIQLNIDIKHRQADGPTLKSMMCNYDSGIGIGIGFQEFSGMVELESGIFRGGGRIRKMGTIWPLWHLCQLIVPKVGSFPAGVDKGTLSPARRSATALCELPLGDFCYSGFPWLLLFSFPKTLCDSLDILAYVRFFAGHFRLSQVIFRLRMTGEQRFLRQTFPLAGHFVRRSRSSSADIFKICSMFDEFREAFRSW